MRPFVSEHPGAVAALPPAEADEAAALRACVAAARLPAGTARRIEGRAARWVEAVRSRRFAAAGLEAFLGAYGLSSREGTALLCLAEALLRIPDADTADALIRDTIGGGDWRRHLGAADSLLVNAATWALMLTGRVVGHGATGGERADTVDATESGWRATLAGLAGRVGEPIVRAAVREAMTIVGGQFVMGRDIGEALAQAGAADPRERHSFDMLGEGALTAADATLHLDRYAAAIAAVGRAADGRGPIEGPGVSVKLSALHPRFETAQVDRVLRELAPRLAELARLARTHDIALTIDAEESTRTALTVAVLERVARDSALAGWDGLGLAVQAYLRGARALIARLADLAASAGRRLMVRLVKGAYWDSEIKRAQELGLAQFPVLTRKVSTDVSYLACARALIAAPRAFYPCFATHNAHTAAAVAEVAGAAGVPFEFQRLHGMGTALYAAILDDMPAAAVRIYAPVGAHADLVPYLVRRLLENGANTSFVKRLTDAAAPVSAVVADPVAAAERLTLAANPRITAPAELFAPERRNSAGLDLADLTELARLKQEMQGSPAAWSAAPVIAGAAQSGAPRAVLNPADRADTVGTVVEAEPAHMALALAQAHAAQPAWDTTPAAARAAMLDTAAELFERHRAELMALAVREAGKTIPDALAEVREAVDFLRYYAARARADFAAPRQLPGPAGEDNRLSLHGRGVFLCISPWNFPLAIFTGQVAAALAAGNAVLAKPAEQTTLIAARAVALLHAAGVPAEVLHLVPGDGPRLAGAVLGDARLAGVAFTGSTAAAQAINRALAARDGPIAALIAETGGQNAMIADSSAYAEQVARDAVTSAFRSAGQRCSALRVLFLQDDTADRVVSLIAGAMAELNVGDPALIATDLGPVIDAEALDRLNAHCARMLKQARLVARAPIDAAVTARGTFLAPHAFEIDGIEVLAGEVFGPVLHIVRYARERLDAVIDAINATGYGLTASVHSRIDSRVAHIVAGLKVGNVYVNRNQIGAVVGAQPFGGEGLSGTGPKAGGPHYLARFAVERALSTDTTAKGGNAALLAVDD